MQLPGLVFDCPNNLWASLAWLEVNIIFLVELSSCTLTHYIISLISLAMAGDYFQVSELFVSNYRHSW